MSLSICDRRYVVALVTLTSFKQVNTKPALSRGMLGSKGNKSIATWCTMIRLQLNARLSDWGNPRTLFIISPLYVFLQATGTDGIGEEQAL